MVLSKMKTRKVHNFCPRNCLHEHVQNPAFSVINLAKKLYITLILPPKRKVGDIHSCQTFEILWEGSKTPQKEGQRW